MVLTGLDLLPAWLLRLTFFAILFFDGGQGTLGETLEVRLAALNFFFYLFLGCLPSNSSGFALLQALLILAVQDDVENDKDDIEGD